MCVLGNQSRDQQSTIRVDFHVFYKFIRFSKFMPPLMWSWHMPYGSQSIVFMNNRKKIRKFAFMKLFEFYSPLKWMQWMENELKNALPHLAIERPKHTSSIIYIIHPLIRHCSVATHNIIFDYRVTSRKCISFSN